MGPLTIPVPGFVYMDTNALIYAVERIEPHVTRLTPLWQALADGRQQVVTSELTLLEVLVRPLRLGEEALAALYREVLFGTAGLTSLPITRSCLERAATLRAAYGLRTPDAIHAATALEMGALLFVTNDRGFRRVPDLAVLLLDEIGDPDPSDTP